MSGVIISLAPLFVVPLFTGQPPPPDASGEAMIAFYSAHGSALLAAGWVRALGLPLSLVLVAGLTSLMRRAEGDAGWLYLVFLMASLVSISLATTLAAVGQVLDSSSAIRDPAVVKALSDLTGLGFALYFIPSAVAWVAAAAVIARTAVLPRWLAWWALLVVATSLVASLGMFVESGPVAAKGFGAFGALIAQFGWYFAASIVLIARPRV